MPGTLVRLSGHRSYRQKEATAYKEGDSWTFPGEQGKSVSMAMASPYYVLCGPSNTLWVIRRLLRIEISLLVRCLRVLRSK